MLLSHFSPIYHRPNYILYYCLRLVLWLLWTYLCKWKLICIFKLKALGRLKFNHVLVCMLSFSILKIFLKGENETWCSQHWVLDYLLAPTPQSGNQLDTGVIWSAFHNRCFTKYLPFYTDKPSYTYKLEAQVYLFNLYD